MFGKSLDGEFSGRRLKTSVDAAMSPAPAPDARPSPAKFILAFVAICAIEKAIAMLVTGFDDDEAYTLVISRTLALSYFDHPPLHQWILHGFVALFGESRWARAPFWLMIVAINWPLFGLTRRLFGGEAALWALFAFNATAYFLVLPDGFIMPDTPLLLSLAVAGWAIAEILFAPPGRNSLARALVDRGPRAGLARGWPNIRRFLRPSGSSGFSWARRAIAIGSGISGPGSAPRLALLVFSPALLWNAENHWVSFAFQSNRAATGLALGGAAWTAVAAGLGAQVALISPWVGAPLVVGAGAGDARGRRQRRTFPALAGDAARAAVRPDAAARAARDPALVQFRLAVRISAGGRLARRAERRHGSEHGRASARRSRRRRWPSTSSPSISGPLGCFRSRRQGRAIPRDSAMIGPTSGRRRPGAAE